MGPQEKTVTLPELATLIGVLPDTLRMWFRRDYFEGREGQNEGWKRFDVRAAARIACFAEVFKKTSDRQFALECVDALTGHVAATLDGFDPEGLWLVLYRDIPAEGPLAGKSNVEAEHLETEEAMLQFIRELTDGTTHFGNLVYPTVIPIHRLWHEIASKLSGAFDLGTKEGKE